METFILLFVVALFLTVAYLMGLTLILLGKQKDVYLTPEHKDILNTHAFIVILSLSLILILGMIGILLTR